ncbi:MAG TPA: TIGR03560 family F420-dependent LLM class oxidoreductase [Acidimicrobiia bacterium]|nr:TIGR03560 family F420-dependent LLM class oxidoreductase [Acidimicrobiia bacterium]
MRFGAFVPQGWRLDLVGIDPSQHWPAMTAATRAIEASGFESAWVYDHFHTVPVATQEVTYEAWALMAALAAVTEKVRLGQMCTCNSYRHPSYLAKAAASIDVISGGRLEMGIGAGWYQEEYEGYGYEFPKASVRLGQLEEGVQIMKRMWTEDVVHFEGRHYQLKGAICRPKPLQTPHVPIWVAGGGEQLTLRTAARHAQYTNFGNDLEQFIHKSAILEEHCRREGTSYEAIVRSKNFSIICAASEPEVEERLAWLKDKYLKYAPEARAESEIREFRRISGTPDQIVEKIRAWETAGMTYAIGYFPDLAFDPSGLQLFAAEVMPAFPSL